MKINSNTIVLAKESNLYKELEQVVTKIAEENKISNIEQASLDVTKDNSLVSFKIAEELEQSVVIYGPYRGSTIVKTIQLTQIDNNSVLIEDLVNAQDPYIVYGNLKDMIKYLLATGIIETAKDGKLIQTDISETDPITALFEKFSSLSIKIRPFKIARDPYLEEGLYKGSLSQQELTDLQGTLNEDAKYVPVGSEQEKMVQEQLGMINEQLGASKKIDQVNLQDPYSFAPQQYASNEEALKKIAEMYEEGYSEEDEISKIDDVYTKAKELVLMHEDANYTEEEELALIKEIFEKSKYMLDLHGIKIASKSAK